ncbi:MAG: multiheme c-type cytochrome, partial [Verrucomicrobiota bacterium]
MRWCINAALLLALLAGCGREPPRPTDLRVYFTCDTHGRLEPCGCFVGQFGGLTRLKSVLDAEAPGDALRLDIGDAAAGPEDYDFIEYGYMLKAFAAMKFDALNIGAREACFGAGQLREVRQKSTVPVLSANVLDASTHQPIFDPYLIVRRGDVRIALIGVLDPRMVRNPGPGVAVGGMEAAIQHALAEVRGKSDLVLLLAFTDEETLVSLAREFYECGVILGGKVSQPAQQLVRANRSLIYFVTNEARALGILQLRLFPGKPPEVTDNEVRFLNDKIPQDAAFRQMMQDYRGEIRKTRLAVDDPGYLAADTVPGVRTAATYVGSDKCLDCHPGAAAVWKNSAHARAFRTLAERNADADPKCIGCHTVGFGSPTGYRRGPAGAGLANVGCESCHGPGSLHVR